MSVTGDRHIYAAVGRMKLMQPLMDRQIDYLQVNNKPQTTPYQDEGGPAPLKGSNPYIVALTIPVT